MFQTIKNVFKHTVVYGIGDILAKLVGFLLIPLYTHYFSTAEYGTLELLDLSSHIVSLLLAMGIAEAMVRFYFDSKEPEHREKVVGVSLIATWTISILGICALIPAAGSISMLVFQSYEQVSLFYLVFIAIGLALCNEIPLQLLRIEQRSVLYTAISLVRLFIQLSLNIYFIVVAELGIAGILWSTLITNFILGVVLTASMLRRFKISFDFALFKEMLIYGLPLIGSWAGSFLLHFADRFLLQRLSSLSQVGIYALSYKFGFLVSVFVLVPFKKTWMPKQFEVVDEPDAPRTFARVFTYYSFVQLYFTLGISALIEDVVFIVAEQKFHSSYLFVPLLLLAYNCNGYYQFFEFALLYKKKTRQLAALTISAGLLNIACNLFLIPRYGAWGATWSTFIAFTYLATSIFFYAQRLYYIPVEFRRMITMFIVAAALYTAATFIRVDSIFLSIALRGLIAASFPLFFLFIPFLEEEEKNGIAAIWQDRKNWRRHLSAIVSRKKTSN